MRTISKKIVLAVLVLGIAVTALASSIIAFATSDDWTEEDFMYSGNATIIAFSDKGIEKAKHKSVLTFPEGTKIIHGNYSTDYPQDPLRYEREFGRKKHWERVEFPDSLEEIGYAVFYGGKVDEVIFSKNLKKIGAVSFHNNGLTEVNFPDGLQKIGHNAFEKNHLTEIVIPASVQVIDQYAFVANKLHKITLLGNTDISKTSIFAKQNAVYMPNQNPFYQEHFGLNGKIEFEHLADGLNFIDGEYAFSGDEVSEVTMPFSLSGTSYSGTMTIINPKKYSQGTQVKPEVEDEETQTEPTETNDQSTQTAVEVKVKYLLEDNSIFQEYAIEAEIGAVLDAGDLPTIPDDMEFKDDFLFYEVKGDGKDLIERVVAFVKQDESTQTEETEKKDASTQTDLTMEDLDELDKQKEECKEKVEQLEKELAESEKTNLEKDKELKELKEQIDKLKKELKEKTDKVSEADNKELVDRITALEKQVSELEKKVKDLISKEDKKFQNECKDLEKKVEELSNSLKDKTEVNQKQEKTIDTLEKEIKDLKEKLNAKPKENLNEKDNKELINKIKELESKINSIKPNVQSNTSTTTRPNIPQDTTTQKSETKVHDSGTKDNGKTVDVLENPVHKTENDTSTDKERKEVRYPNKSTPKPPLNPVETKDGKVVNNNKGEASKPSKARGTVTENVDNANNEYPIYHGNSECRDYSADARQFVTFTTKNGKSFYLIINHDEEDENVMLLTEVSEDDLLNMVEPKEKAKEEVKEDVPVKVEEPKEEKEETPVKEEKKSSSGTYLLLLLIVGGVLGAGYYFKVIKGKENNELEGFEEEAEDDYFDEVDHDEEDIDTEDLL